MQMLINQFTKASSHLVDQQEFFPHVHDAFDSLLANRVLFIMAILLKLKKTEINQEVNNVWCNTRFIFRN